MTMRPIELAKGALVFGLLLVAMPGIAGAEGDVRITYFQSGDSNYSFEGGFTNPPPTELHTPGMDPVLFSLADTVMGKIAGGGFLAVSDRLNTFKKTTIAARIRSTQPDTAFGQQAEGPEAQGFAITSIGGWTQVFGLAEATATAKPFDDANPFSGATIGFDFMLSPQTVGGMFFGGSMGSMDDGSTSNDIRANGFYMGVYLSRMVGSYFLDFTLGSGITDQDTSRSDFQTQKAKASYAGYFINPAFKVSSFTTVFDQLLIPSVSVSYSGFFFDGYEETGSAGNLTVDGRQTHLVTGRAQIAVPFTHKLDDGSAFKIETRTGFDARFDLSTDALATTQQGVGFDYAPDGADRTLGVFLGLDTTYRFSNGVLLYGEFEGLVTTKGSIDAFTRFGTRFSF